MNIPSFYGFYKTMSMVQVCSYLKIFNTKVKSLLIQVFIILPARRTIVTETKAINAQLTINKRLLRLSQDSWSRRNKNSSFYTSLHGE